MSTIAELLQQGLHYHQAGALPQAEQLYRQVLQAAPHHADALHLLSVLTYQVGKQTAALELLRDALARHPADGRYHNTLAAVYLALQDGPAAAESARQALRLLPSSAEAHFNLGTALKQQGRLDEAAVSLQQALRLRPDFDKAHNNLGNVLQQQNRLEEAVAHYQAAVRSNPRHAEALNNLANALHKLGKLEEAAAAFQRVLLLKPDWDQVHNDLGTVLQAQGKLDQAVTCYRQALRCNPQLVQALLNLATALRQQGKGEEAAAQCRQALRLQPQLAEGYYELGVALQAQGQTDEAIAAYGQALELRPDFVDAYTQLGNLWQEQNLEKALTFFRQAVRAVPHSAAAHNNLGSIQRLLGNDAEAEACFLQAIRFQPDGAEAYVSLGRLYLAAKRLEDAAQLFQHALQCKPDLAEAHSSLGGVFSLLGKVDEAGTCLREAIRLRPTAYARLLLAIRLPIIYQSVAELEVWRKRLVQEIQMLHEQRVLIDLTEQAVPTLFLLAYQGRNDRDILRDAARLCKPPDPANGPAVLSDPRHRKIRVGIISAHFCEHSVGRWMRGLAAQLSRDHFHVTVLSVGSRDDEIADFFKQHADCSLQVPKHLGSARRLIADQKLDVLLYTDIGMDPLTQTLAHSRLAPVQCTTLGHPVTTGIATLDYFISAVDLETEEAQEHYTETLIRLNTMPIYFYRPQLEGPLKQREDFGLTPQDHLYACLQSLFKFHPEFDEILGGILRSDPQGILLLSKGRYTHHYDLLLRRFAATLPDVVHRIRFLPVLDYHDYLNLLALTDVMLDPRPFGGGTTAYEGFAVGTPIVTLPTHFLRGRITYALYKQMGVLDCVAANTQEYIDLALGLGTDADHHASIRQKIMAANSALYENAQGVRELEQFFRQAVVSHQASSLE